MKGTTFLFIEDTSKLAEMHVSNKQWLSAESRSCIDPAVVAPCRVRRIVYVFVPSSALDSNSARSWSRAVEFCFDIFILRAPASWLIFHVSC